MSNQKIRYALYCLCVFAIGMSIVFLPVLPKYTGLIAPDSMPFFAWPWRTPQVENLLAEGTFSPHNLYWLILHPLYAHELTYIIDTLVLTLGAVYYLHTQRLHPLSAWFGGLALGFCGYTFTLFSAGHRGYFHMFSCAVWAFGLIVSGFATRRLTPFALLGLVLAWGVSYQPDVLLLVGALAAAYVLWLTFSKSKIQNPHHLAAFCDLARHTCAGRFCRCPVGGDHADCQPRCADRRCGRSFGDGKYGRHAREKCCRTARTLAVRDELESAARGRSGVPCARRLRQ